VQVKGSGGAARQNTQTCQRYSTPAQENRTRHDGESQAEHARAAEPACLFVVPCLAHSPARRARRANPAPRQPPQP